MRFAVRGKRHPILLHNTVINGKEADVKKALSAGWFVDAVDDDGRTPLHYAAGKGKLGIAKLLIENGASVFLTDREGMTPLHHAAISGRAMTARWLIEHGGAMATVNIQDNYLRTPLHYAAATTSCSLVDYLIRIGHADLCVHDFDYKIPLEYARGDNISIIIQHMKVRGIKFDYTCGVPPIAQTGLPSANAFAQIPAGDADRDLIVRNQVLSGTGAVVAETTSIVAMNPIVNKVGQNLYRITLEPYDTRAQTSKPVVSTVREALSLLNAPIQAPPDPVPPELPSSVDSVGQTPPNQEVCLAPVEELPSCIVQEPSDEPTLERLVPDIPQTEVTSSAPLFGDQSEDSNFLSRDEPLPFGDTFSTSSDSPFESRGFPFEESDFSEFFGRSKSHLTDLDLTFGKVS